MIMFPSSLFLKQSLNQKIVLEPRGIHLVRDRCATSMINISSDIRHCEI